MKYKIGELNNIPIMAGDENCMGGNEYYLQLSKDNTPMNLYYNGKCILRTPQLKLEEVEFQEDYQGDEITKTPSSGYDGIGKVTYNEPRLTEKEYDIPSDHESTIVIVPDKICSDWNVIFSASINVCSFDVSNVIYTVSKLVIVDSV